jgi:hypothetical protein
MTRLLELGRGARPSVDWRGMRWSASSLVFLVLLIATLGGCGDDQAEAEEEPDAQVEPPGPPGPPSPPLPTPSVPPGPPELAAVCGESPVTLEDWERCFLQRTCEVLAHCGGIAYYSSAQECVDLSNAVSGGQRAFALGERARALVARRASLNVAMYTECLLGLSADQCATGRRAPACQQLFTGTIADYAACYADIDCASPGATCAPSDCGESCCLGTCQPLPRLGDPCQGSVGCEPGLACGRQGRCVSGDIGIRCTSSADCDWNAWCDRNAQVCKSIAQEGQPCQTFTQCGGETFCVGLFRPVQQPRCMRVTHAGDLCDGDCLGNFYCKMPPSGLGVCAPFPTHGEGCSLFLPCVGANEICEAGVCIARSDVGQPCMEGTCQRGLFCAPRAGGGSPVCQEPLADGQMGCRRPEECESYICSGNPNQAGVCQPYRAVCP